MPEPWRTIADQTRAFLRSNVSGQTSTACQQQNYVSETLVQMSDRKNGFLEEDLDCIHTQQSTCTCTWSHPLWHQKLKKKYIGHILPTMFLFPQLHQASSLGSIRSVPSQITGLRVPLRVRLFRACPAMVSFLVCFFSLFVSHL